MQSRNTTRMFAMILASALMISQSLASGWGDLSGKNGRGEVVGVHPEWDTWEELQAEKDFSLEENKDLYYVYVWKGRGTSRKEIATHKHQRCTYELDKEGMDRRFFTCEKSGVSPLSGTRYKMVENPKPGDCSYETKYVCVGGCGAPSTPREMFQSYWECDEGVNQ